MAFHADFWVVAGTAAPVILLAQIVVAGDALVARAAARGTVPSEPRLLKRRQLKVAAISYGLSGANIGLQGTILLGSLASLDQEQNIVPTPAVGFAEVLGMLMLFYASLALVKLKISQAVSQSQRKTRISVCPGLRAARSIGSIRTTPAM